MVEIAPEDSFAWYLDKEPPIPGTLGALSVRDVLAIVAEERLSLKHKLLSQNLLAPGTYWCNKCGYIHYETSKIGIKHHQYGVTAEDYLKLLNKE